jgi:hypothetical protein
MHGISGGAESLDIQDISDATGNLSAMMQDWADDSEIVEQTQLQASQTESAPIAQGPSDDWTPTFQSAETTEEGGISLQQQPNAQDSVIEEDVEHVLTNEMVEQVPVEIASVKSTGPRKANIIKKSIKKNKLPPIFNRKHTMQANAAIQVVKDSPNLPQLTINAQPEKHLSRSIQEHDVKQRKALNETFKPIAHKEDSELQQASVQSAAKRNATLPPTADGPNALDGIIDLRPIGTETNLTPSMAMDSIELNTQNNEEVRESASRSQSTKTIRAVVEKWNDLGSKSLLENSTLYDDEGNAIERYGGQ